MYANSQEYLECHISIVKGNMFCIYGEGASMGFHFKVKRRWRCFSTPTQLKYFIFQASGVLMQKNFQGNKFLNLHVGFFIMTNFCDQQECMKAYPAATATESLHMFKHCYWLSFGNHKIPSSAKTTYAGILPISLWEALSFSLHEHWTRA